MGFGSLKTLKLERTLGDAVLSITKHVPTDASDIEEFNKLDESIIGAATHLRDYSNTNGVSIKAEPPKKVVETIVENPDVIKPAPKKRGPKPKNKPAPVKEEPTLKPATKPEGVAKVIETIVDQAEKVALVQKFQASFESEVGFTSEDTYMTEFNDFMKSLISMEYKAFLDSDITESQLKTFSELI